MAKMEPVTLNEEWVKSFEEVLIADWLTIHGINYEYEKPYEHKPALGSTTIPAGLLFDRLWDLLGTLWYRQEWEDCSVDESG